MTIDLRTTTPKGKPRKVPLTDDDIARGNMAIKWARRTYLAGLIATLGIVIFVWTQVPVMTSTSYTRLSNDYAMPSFMLLLFPAICVGGLISSRGAQSGYMPASESSFVLAFAPILVIGVICATAYLASTYLAAGA